MNGKRIGGSDEFAPPPPPKRDPWSKAEIIAVVIGAVAGIIVIPLVAYINSTLTDLNVRTSRIETRLEAISDTLVSMDGRLGKLEDWQIDHLKGHPMVRVGSEEVVTGE